MVQARSPRRLVRALLYRAARENRERLVFLRTDDGCRVLAADAGGLRTLTEPDFTEHGALLGELAALSDAELDAHGQGQGELDFDADEHGVFRARVAFDPGLRGEGRAVVELALA